MVSAASQRKQFLLDTELKELLEIADPEAAEALRSLVDQHWIDLVATVRGSFSREELLLISGESGRRLKDSLWDQASRSGSGLGLGASVKLSAESVRASWQAIVEDFHRTKYWGFVPRPSSFEQQSETFKALERFEDRKSERRRPEVDRKELRRYILTFVQLMILSKAIILFFGLRGCSS